MPLRDGYGFVVGTKARYFRDDPDDFGRFYHGNLIVGTPQGEYRCAIDVDPKNTPDGIEWRVVESERRRHGAVQSIAERIAPACVKPDVGCDGLHPLADAAPADRDHTRALRRFSREGSRPRQLESALEPRHGHGRVDRSRKSPGGRGALLCFRRAVQSRSRRAQHPPEPGGSGRVFLCRRECDLAGRRDDHRKQRRANSPRF